MRLDPTPLSVLLALLLAAAGCDGSFNLGGDDDAGPGDDDDAGPGDDDDGSPCTPDEGGGEVEVEADCFRVQPYEEFDPVELIEWQWTGSQVDPASRQVMMTPIVVNLTDDDGDGAIDAADTPDVLFSSYIDGEYNSDGRLRAISGADGSDLWTLSDPVYATYPGAGLAAGDLDLDGLVEIVAITDDGEVMLVGHDGVVDWVTAAGYGFTHAHPSIADLYGDGEPEIIIGNLILDPHGSFLAQGQYGWGGNAWGPINFAADVDGDGVQEIVADNAVYEPDGTALWAFPDRPAGYPAVADFDLDGDPELVVVAGGDAYLYDAATGALIWGPVTVDAGGGRGGPPTVADYDGDGYPEIGVAGLGYYTAIDTDGSYMWSNPTEDDSSSMTGSSVFDFNGDGVAEVVYADEHALYVYEGPTGTILFTAESHASGTLWETPLVVDIDHDFSGEIVLASNDMWWEGWCGITVLGAVEQSWFPARGIWNQHAYSITNVDDDGRIPAHPEPPWAAYNSFRRNTLSDESVLWAANLAPYDAQWCTETCPEALTLWVEASNSGLLDTNSGVGVSIWALDPQGPPTHVTTAYFPEAIPSGAITAPLTIELDPADVAGKDIRIGIDVLPNFPEGLYVECDETDNALVIQAPDCP